MYSSKTFNTKKVSVATDEPKTWPPKVTHRNPKTGLVERQEPYIMRTVKDKNNNRINYLEYPAGSGNLWTRDWEPMGRWDKEKPEGQRFIKDAQHVAWTPPETQDQQLAKQMAADKLRIAELEKELASIQAEKDTSAKLMKKKEPGA